MDNFELMERVERAIARIERATSELKVLQERLTRTVLALDEKGPDAAA